MTPSSLALNPVGVQTITSIEKMERNTHHRAKALPSLALTREGPVVAASEGAASTLFLEFDDLRTAISSSPPLNRWLRKCRRTDGNGKFFAVEKSSGHCYLNFGALNPRILYRFTKISDLDQSSTVDFINFVSTFQIHTPVKWAFDKPGLGLLGLR